MDGVVFVGKDGVLDEEVGVWWVVVVVSLFMFVVFVVCFCVGKKVAGVDGRIIVARGMGARVLVFAVFVVVGMVGERVRCSLLAR